jgi:hypothetical protein
MKQYKSISLALLLSAPAFGMHQIPTPIKDSTEATQTSQAFIGFHTFKDDEEAIPAINDQVTTSSTESATQLTKVVEAGELLKKADGYESDTEKGLSKENTQLYRFTKLTESIKQILIEANPLLLTWCKNPITTQPSPKLVEYAKNLGAQLNRMEAWQKQLDSFTYRKITGYANLKICFETMAKRIGEFTPQENFKQAVDDISNPAVQFLMTVERLEQLLK